MHKTLLKMEGGFWITRPHGMFGKFPLSYAAWLVGRDSLRTHEVVPDLRTIIVLALFVGAYQASLIVCNDWLDAEKDKRSAPYLPIPVGVVARRHALLEGLFFGAVFLALLGILSSDRRGAFLALSTMPAALLTIKLYGRTKSKWYSAALASTAAASGPLWAWLLAGSHNLALFGLVFAIALTHGLHTNIRAQLRDIEGDPKAGNTTLAVKLGPKRIFRATVALRAVELAGIAALCWYTNITGSFFWFIVALLIFAGCLTRSRLYEQSRSRIDQTRVLTPWVYASLLAEIAVLGAFEPVSAGAVLVFMVVWFNVLREGYRMRIEQHGLATALRNISSTVPV